MRKALFAVMLVAASFAGGAVANGPGLRWAKAMILDRLGGGDDEGDNQASAQPVVGEPEPIPSKPLPKLVVEPSGPKGKDATASATPATAEPNTSANPFGALQTPEPKAPAPPESKPATLDDDLARVKPANDAGIVPARTQTGAGDGTPAPLEPLDPVPLPLTSPNDHAAGPAGEKGQEPPWADAPGSTAPATAVPPRPFDQPGRPAPPAADAKPAPSANANANAGEPPRSSSSWAEIRRKMAALGVSRYAIEGEPNGRVRFHCIIPLAGRRAVANQFEAEGDDELQAAEAVLRRVALWRATEGPGP